MKYDFSGWATRNDILCSDGRTIKKDAFIKNDGMIVPLVWNHQHNDPTNVLGHALLKNRPDGVYAYGVFNKNEVGETAKELVRNGDISALSIFATGLKHDQGRNVLHGDIKEVSLVLAGANKGAYIDNVSLQHSDGSYEQVVDEAYISFIDDESISHSEVEYEEVPAETKEESSLTHAEEEAKGEENVKDKKKEAAGKTVKEIYDTLNDDQKELLNFMVAKALEDAKNGKAEEEEEDEDTDMKHNLFDSSTETYGDNVLSHAEIKGYADEITQAAIGDIKRYGSLRDSVLAHAEQFGIENLSLLFPDAKTLTDSPEFIKRQTEWVGKFMAGTRHTPFSRIRSVFANITEDDARAKGYIKGKLKKEEVFSLLKRVTTPTTVYKKQKFNRDDILDVTEMDVIAFSKGEMRLMMDEEIARAALVGDGRLASSDDKIAEDHIRPIASDADLFTIKKQLTGADIAAIAAKFVDEFVVAMDEYRGSGNPTMFIRQDLFTRLMLLKDNDGHRLYKSANELATALMVGEVIKMPTEILGKNLAIAVNLNDYTFGADKGGEVSMFEDFDIDYNQQKYLLETRCSGALVKPFSAIAFSENKVTTTDEAGGITGTYKKPASTPHVG